MKTLLALVLCCGAAQAQSAFGGASAHGGSSAHGGAASSSAWDASPIDHKISGAASGGTTTTAALSCAAADTYIIAVSEFTGSALAGTFSSTPSHGTYSHTRLSQFGASNTDSTVLYYLHVTGDASVTFTYAGGVAPMVAATCWKVGAASPFDQDSVGVQMINAQPGSITLGTLYLAVTSLATEDAGTPSVISSGFTIIDAIGLNTSEGGGIAFFVGTGAKNPTWTTGANAIAGMATFIP